MSGDRVTTHDLSDAVQSLDGWEVEKGALRRRFTAAGHEGAVLADHLRTALRERGAAGEVRIEGDVIEVVLGAGGASSDDVEVAAELDSVISGGSPTPGTT